jgi:hypothetical protein
VPAGIISTTGIAGLTLSGGHGYLSRRHGLTIDSLLEADVVLAVGRFVTASGSEHTDLFGALRGGGGNFGVVRSLLFRLHRVSRVCAGPIAFDQAHVRAIMRRYREFLPDAAKELNIFLGLRTILSCKPFPAERWGKRVCLLMCCDDGAVADGRRALAPLLDSLPEPWFNWMGEMPYPAGRSRFDGLYLKGMQRYWRGDFVRMLTDEAIETHIAQAAQSPAELCVMQLHPIDGAVSRVGSTDTAWNCRDATWLMMIAGIYRDPKMAGAVKRWGKGYRDAVHSFNAGGAYPNFMMDDEGGHGRGRLSAKATHRWRPSRRRMIRRISSGSITTSGQPPDALVDGAARSRTALIGMHRPQRTPPRSRHPRRPLRARREEH